MYNQSVNLTGKKLALITAFELVLAFSVILRLDAVIFVVDSADVDRLNVAKAELTAILKVFCHILNRS